VINQVYASRDLKRELIRGFVKGKSAPAGIPRPPGPLGGFFLLCGDFTVLLSRLRVSKGELHGERDCKVV
jgi:hypothetical protein